MHREGQPWDRPTLVRCLSHVLYVGEVRHRGKIYVGEQTAIVERTIWRRAQRLLQRGKDDGASRKRNRQGALLQGLLVCAGCGKRMTAGYTTRHGRRYRYYVCVTAQKSGRRVCSGGQLSARRVEEAVVEALYEVAGQAGEAALPRALPADRKVWEELKHDEQHQIVVAVVERIIYDRRLQQGHLLLRPEVTREPAEEVLIQAGKKPLVKQIAPKADPPSTPAKGNRVPRITQLMALAEAGETHRRVIFSGMTSVGTQGAAEFFSQPEGLAVLRSRLASEGYKSFPKSYQVVVRCASNDTLLLSTEYAAHRVITR